MFETKSAERVDLNGWRNDLRSISWPIKPYFCDGVLRRALARAPVALRRAFSRRDSLRGWTGERSTPRAASAKSMPVLIRPLRIGKAMESFVAWERALPALHVSSRPAFAFDFSPDRRASKFRSW